MKKSLIIAVLAASLLLVGCGLNTPDPETAKTVMATILDDMKTSNVEDFKKHLLEVDVKEFEKKGGHGPLTIPGLKFALMSDPAEISKDGKTAKVKVMSSYGGFEKVTMWTLIAENGEWKMSAAENK